MHSLLLGMWFDIFVQFKQEILPWIKIKEIQFDYYKNVYTARQVMFWGEFWTKSVVCVEQLLGGSDDQEISFA